MPQPDWKAVFGNILADAVSEVARVGVEELRTTVRTATQHPQRAPRTQTPYQILGVVEDADLEDCEAAFKSRSRRFHPDTAPPGDDAERQRREEIQKGLGGAIAAIRAAKSTPPPSGF